MMSVLVYVLSLSFRFSLGLNIIHIIMRFK